MINNLLIVVLIVLFIKGIYELNKYLVYRAIDGILVENLNKYKEALHLILQKGMKETDLMLKNNLKETEQFINNELSKLYNSEMEKSNE